MSWSFEKVAVLAKDTVQRITSSPAQFMDFLKTAGSNYKYPFEDQVLIYAQRPKATACAEMPTWNRIGRRVNKGATGIALFGLIGAARPVRYVFDISDTTSYYGQDRPNLVWQLREDAHDAVLRRLEWPTLPMIRHPRFAPQFSKVLLWRLTTAPRHTRRCFTTRWPEACSPA